jgi:superfamily II DNA/RNA helicase
MRQTLFFSATMPPEIRRLADRFLSNPKEVTVSPPASAGTNIVQGLVVVPEAEKREALRALIKSQELKNALVFCNRKRDVVTLHGSLKKHGFNAGALHGDMSQPARMETLERFKQGEIQILVASDVAARGLDIVDMSHVFNFDVPFSPEDYVHRIGRTGRAGKTGHSFTLASPSDGGLIDAIEKLIGTTIPRIEVPGLETATLEAGDGRRRGRGRGRGGRGGRASSDKPREHREPRGHREPKPKAAEHAKEPRAERPPRERRPEHHAEHRKADSHKADHHKPDHRKSEHHRAEHHKGDRRHERREPDRQERDKSPAPKGLGDHVPAFLARPSR